MSRGREARQLVRTHRSGVLSTHSVKHPGYPYGSALPHVTDHAGRPVVLISHLAEHTVNIGRDPRVAFTASPLTPRLQAEARLAVLGDAAPVEAPDIAGRYLRIHPEGEEHLAIGGFRFFRIEPRAVRLIAGFQFWSEGGWLLVLSGIFGIAAGVIILMGWPESSLWVIGLLLGIGQFASTFLITFLYVRHANRRLDPLADKIRTDLESR